MLLRSLIITSPTNRSIPVVDFVLLDQRKNTMIEVLKYFQLQKKAEKHRDIRH